MMYETRKILEDESIGVAVTCVRVLVRHSGTRRPSMSRRASQYSPGQVRDLLGEGPGVIVEDVATPLRSAGRDEVFVGRIRRDEFASASIEHVDRERQPAQGRRHKRRPDRRGLGRARAALAGAIPWRLGRAAFPVPARRNALVSSLTSNSTFRKE